MRYIRRLRRHAFAALESLLQALSYLLFLGLSFWFVVLVVGAVGTALGIKL